LLWLEKGTEDGIKWEVGKSIGKERAWKVLVPEDRERFERLILPHQDAAFNLARWLMRSRTDAEDVTQDAMVRAFRFFPGFHGGDARAWLLQIVRNACYTWMEKYRSVDLTTEFDESVHLPGTATPESAAVAANERERLMKALERLPPRAREALVLRELEGCSYKEIATITSVPIGTVMSTLARARGKLQEFLRPASGESAAKEVRRDL
jgi:RNA polymerase sigma-70 factor (ECF subfamily)